jgi:hypothetical protein
MWLRARRTIRDSSGCMRLRDHRLTTTGSISVTGRVERLTRAPWVSLQGLSTLFTSVIQTLTAVIGGFGGITGYILTR